MSGKVKGALVLGTGLLALTLTLVGLGRTTAAAPTRDQDLAIQSRNTDPALTPAGALQPSKPMAIADVQAHVLQPCSLITAPEAADLLESGVQAPQEVDGACVYASTPDGRYSVSVSAAQGQETQAILDNQLLLVTASGANIDQTDLEHLQSLEQGGDFTRFFEELVAATNGASSMRTRLVMNSDHGYWAWFTSGGHAQGILVLARDDTLVEVNVTVGETNDEHAILEAAIAQADLAFRRLPANFVLPPSIE
jgi:hypothetical protein